MTEIGIICAEGLAWCICCLQPDHEGPHRCLCGGSWSGSEATGDLEIVGFPCIPGGWPW